MKTFFTILAAGLFSLAAHAAAPPPRSAKALKTAVQGQTFTATLLQGFHFNEKAPNGLQNGAQFVAPSTLEKRKLVLTPLPSGFEKATMHLYVCDDAQTFCEVHNLPMGNSTKKTAPPQSHAAHPGKKNEHGFLTDFEEALRQASKSKKLILADFSARWCPGCVRLESEIFPLPQFKKLTADFVKVKIDTDILTNSAISARYAIRGIPSLIMMTPSGQEIARLYDYQPLSTLESLFAEAQKSPVSIQQLEQAEPTAANQELLAIRYYFAGQFDKAAALMEKQNPKPKEYLDAKVEMAAAEAKKNTAAKDKLNKALAEALKAEGDTTRSQFWRQSLISLLPEKSKEAQVLARESQKLVDKWLSDEAALKKALTTDSLGEYTGLERFYVAYINGEIVEYSGLPAQAAWAKAAEEGAKAHINAKLPGPALRLRAAYLGAGMTNEAHQLTEELVKARPNDGHVQSQYTSSLLKMKKYKEAAAMGEKALKNSYGLNEFSVAAKLSEAYLGDNQPQKAKKILEEYLAKNEVNSPKLASIKKTMEEMNQKLGAPAKTQ
ncbi:MAG: thioredoxin family protein [Bdellovibrionales bacterium]